MPHIRISEDRYRKVFGERNKRSSGRFYVCRYCGGMHERSAVPHNCRSEPPPRAPLAAPQLAPPFEPFRTGVVEGEVIGSRRDKREYMKRNDLVEYDEGVGRRNDWVEERESQERTTEAVRNFMDMDTESINAHLTRRSGEPVDITNPRRVGEDDTHQAGEVDMNEVEVIE